MAEGDNLDGMTVDELKENLQSRGIVYRTDDRKDDLLALARGQDRQDRPTGGSRGADAGQAEMAEKLGEEQAQGYRGEVPDKTPNSAYTVQGQLAGEKTPEDLNPSNPSQ